MRKWRIAMPIVLGLLALLAPAGNAQEVDPAPQRALAIRAALALAQWEELKPGLAVLSAAVSPGPRITTFRVSPRNFRFAIASQDNPDGERVGAFAERGKAVVAVNGGFFGEKQYGRDLFPVGLLRIAGEERSVAWSQSGGFLVIRRDGLAIRPTRQGAPKAARDVLQSRPVILEPGGRWALNTNGGDWRSRTLVCLFPDGDAAIILVHGGGMSLYEAGWLLRSEEEGGHFGCDSALALDGGGSTQAFVAGRPDLSLEGETRVHNALMVIER
jgi:hypothetical protein